MLSIVTITFNNFEELVKTCNSLLLIPSNFDFEHIIINGGTCEETKAFLDSYSPNYSFKIISEPDKGIYDAFNKGIVNSQGNYIQFLNSGDLLISYQYLEKSILNLNENPEIVFTHGDVNFIDNFANSVHMTPTHRSVGRGMPYLHQTMITRKSTFDLLGMFNTKYRYAADFDFVVKLIAKDLQGKYIPIIAVDMDGDGVSVNQEKDSIDECYQSLKANNALTITNTLGYFERVLLYYVRKFLVTFGFSKILIKLKQIKYKKS